KRLAVQLERLRRHAGGADHEAGAPGRGLEVAADADGVLAEEDELGGHRADRVDQVVEELTLESAEALLLLEELVMAERAAAHLDREAAGLDLRAVDVGRGGVARLVQGDGARL